MSNQLWKSILSSRWCFGRKKANREKSKAVVVATVAQSVQVPPSTNSDKIFSNKRFMDLNDACVEKIFWYLNYDDLLNMVLCNGKFKAIAKKVFLKKYSNEYVVLSNISSFSLYPMLRSSEMDRSIQLLDCFGDVITYLCISFKLENIGCLVNAVMWRCGKNIRKLKLNHANQERKKWVFHEHGTLSVNKLLKCINQQFPHLNELHLIYGSSSDECPYWYDVDEMFIPSLTDFTIDGRFVFDVFKKFIALNPSIENLCVKSQCSDFKWNIDFDFIPLLDNALPQLKYLEMSVGCHVPDQPFGHCYPAYLQHLMKFKSVGHTENMWRPNFYQFAGNELQELEVNELNVMQKSFVDSILHFKQLELVTIEPVAEFSEERRLWLENDINAALTNVARIQIKVARKEVARWPRLDLHQRIQFERNFRDPFHLDFYLHNLVNFEQSSSRIGNSKK